MVVGGPVGAAVGGVMLSTGVGGAGNSYQQYKNGKEDFSVGQFGAHLAVSGV